MAHLNKIANDYATGKESMHASRRTIPPLYAPEPSNAEGGRNRKDVEPDS